MDAYRVAFNTWQEKTEWVQKDKRFDVLLPWGKHRADVLKEYIDHLEAKCAASLDELEAKDKQIDDLKATAAHSNAGWKEAHEQEARAEAAEKRIAEMQSLASGVKQFSEFQICHYGATEDYAKGYIDCQNNYNKVLFAAAGKGE